MRVDVPVALVQHAFADGVEQLLAEKLQRGLLGRNIAKDLDLAQVVHMLDGYLLVTGDLVGGLGSAPQVARENGVDALEGERFAQQAGLEAAFFPQRRGPRPRRLCGGATVPRRPRARGVPLTLPSTP